MTTIKRVALSVRPKEPYIAWAARRRDDARFAPLLRCWTSVYLVDDDTTDRSGADTVQRHYEEIFERELAALLADRALWPASRDFKTFTDWFEVKAEPRPVLPDC
jgi:hypothetical protein